MNQKHGGDRYRFVFALGTSLSLLFGCTGIIERDSPLAKRAPGAETGRPGDDSSVPTNPGKVPLRRLNRAEYNNTARDLFGTNLRPADEFPVDGRLYGYDTIGSALSVSTLHLEMYEQAAKALIDELFARPASDPKRKRLLACDIESEGSECAEGTLTSFAERAFRRPVQAAELAPYVALMADAASDGGIAAGLRFAMQTVLLSPKFLYRMELDPELEASVARRLDGYELANRLSYFIWGSMPDDALFERAERAELSDESKLIAEVERMLKDPKAEALTQNFAGQWLYTRLIDTVKPDEGSFPDFDADLRQAMRIETELFFSEFLRSGKPIRQMVSAPFSFINARLAKHYGIAGPKTEEFERVDLSQSGRIGLLGQATFLTVTSHPNRTSPVKRGKWVLEQLLCSAPENPPPGVDTSLAEKQNENLTLRERLEAHRANPVCNACHEVMDPIGLGLEAFDAIGKSRSLDAGKPIDSSGVLPDGASFDGARELGTILASDERLDTCIAQQLLTYVLGRDMQDQSDARWVDYIAEQARGKSGTTLPSVITSIVKSDAFRARLGSSEE